MPEIATKITADSSGWPTRLIALLIAEPVAAFRTGTDDISVAVSGATTSRSRAPNSRTYGSTSTSVEVGGR